MKVILSEKEINEAVLEWLSRRFPIGDNVGIGWQTHKVTADKYSLEFTVTGVEVPPKDGPFR